MTQIRSPIAVVFGTSCVIGTIIILFGHIRSIDELTTTHLYIMLSLVVTIGAGHFMWDAFGDGPLGFIRGFCLLILFIVGTIVCVGMSGGRSAAIIAARDKDASDQIQRRKDLANELSKHQAEVDKLRNESDDAAITASADEKSMKAECDTGKGKFCDGKKVSATTSRDNADRAYSRLTEALRVHSEMQNKLDNTPIPPPPNAELMSFAQVWAHFSHKSIDDAFNEIKLLMPYALALLTEFGGIVFFKEGFGTPKPKPVAPKEPDALTLVQIAQEIGMQPHVARRYCRELSIPRSPEGWQWAHAEAMSVKQKLITARTSKEVAN